MIKCELVYYKALVALNSNSFFPDGRKKNVQTSISVLDLQAQLYTENSQIFNHDINL